MLLFESVFGLFVCCFAVAAFGFWIWMIVDCINREPPGNDKIVWLLVVILLNWVGAIVYFFARRGKEPSSAEPTFFASPTAEPQPPMKRQEQSRKSAHERAKEKMRQQQPP